MTLTLSKISTLPQVNATVLLEKQLAVRTAEIALGEAACNTSKAWAMFDQAVEDEDQQAKRDCAELAAFCEAVQKMCYQDLEDAKRALLATYS